MRAIHLSDIHFAACKLRCLPPREIEQRMARALAKAHIADKVRKRLGRAHPDFGLGTLISALDDGEPSHAPDRCDRHYLNALSQVVAALLADHHHKT